ncbi:tRNA (cytidine(34)-2'-O)-methyltransferase [Hellea balneolensis]|uniref:tRNA (cytidine(34)-2'-O)-methyltransferase n=1 Tax=Hellea balneolensis TaxID=287478 RepID=UPI00047B9212|nr:tRNA (cytidine(34)-2'-O)-methyltransferase [Hellea balneolensis]
MKIILYQPDMAGNLGAAMRSCACFGIDLEVIEPCGFPLTAKALRRTAMDYGAPETLKRHNSWENFESGSESGRLVLFTTRGATPLTEFKFEPHDRLLFGRESAGVPETVHQAADERVIIPIAKGARSFNLATSVAIAAFEALRQTEGLP